MKPLTPVVQQDATGCGLAVIATLTGQPYAQIKTRAAELGTHPEDKRIWSDTDYVYRLAADQGLTLAVQPTPFHDWDNLPDLAIMAIKWRRIEGVPFWHWVVFQRTEGEPQVLDSGIRLKHQCRRDLWRIQPKWFIEVKG